jgi:hypothetical protein
MGLLIDGIWQSQGYDTKKNGGWFVLLITVLYRPIQSVPILHIHIYKRLIVPNRLEPSAAISYNPAY